MTESVPHSTTTGTRTQITCTKCGKPASVPFVPTPGRPVFCRDCFARPAPSAAPRGGGGFVGAKPNQMPRKRMLAQGRKGHFMHDAKALLLGLPGGMEDKDARAFLEGLFARGARGSTEDAQVFLDEKAAEGTVLTPDQRHGLGQLLERYSFWR